MTTEKESVSLRVDPAFWKKVKMTALEMDMSISEFIEQALAEYMESYLFWVKESVHAALRDPEEAVRKLKTRMRETGK